MYRRFYFQPRAIILIVREMLSDRKRLIRRLREGRAFFSHPFLTQRKHKKSKRLTSKKRDRSSLAARLFAGNRFATNLCTQKIEPYCPHFRRAAFFHGTVATWFKRCAVNDSTDVSHLGFNSYFI